MTAVRTCLWYVDEGEAAAAFYTSLLPGSRIDGIDRPAPDAAPVLVHFTLAGVPYSALNAGQPAPHSHAASIAVTLGTQAEADRLYDRLLENGGTEGQCGWVTDRWGISWQVIPDGVAQALFRGTPEANARAYACLRAMKKLNVADLRAARDTN